MSDHGYIDQAIEQAEAISRGCHTKEPDCPAGDDINAVAKELRELLEKATPGKWELFHHDNTIAIGAPYDLPDIVAWPGFDECLRDTDEHLANATLIVAAHNHLPALLDRLEKLEAHPCKN